MADNCPDVIELHRPYIDNVTIKCPECGKQMHRVSEVIDCWFASGSMPFAQHHYPFENKELFESQFPADFISEAVDQTRGWFYSLLAISTLIFDKAPYKNVIVLGLVQDENGQKMSKSKGEFLTVSLLESKGYDPLVYRFFCLQSHYRKSLVFTYENLDNAKTAYNKLTARIAQLMADKKPDEVVELEDFEKFKGSFKAALDDDINTSNAITVLYDVLKADTNNETKLALIEDFDKVLSLGLIEAAKKLSADGEEDIPEEVKVLVEERKAARKAKDFAKADELRDKIGELGYIVEETRQGTKIKKK